MVDVADPRNRSDRVGDGAMGSGDGVLDELAGANLRVFALLETLQSPPLERAEDEPERGDRNDD